MSKEETGNRRRVKKSNKSGGIGDSQIPTVAGMGGGGAVDYLNITPMIDVMLVLLIIFMVITPLVMSHSVNLPNTVVAKSQKKKHITLTINKQGQFFLEHNLKPIPVGQLSAVIKQKYASQPYDHVLYLKADKSVSYSVVLTAINAAREAGVARMAAITNQLKPKKSNSSK